MLTTAQMQQELTKNALVISDNDNTESDSDNSNFTSDSDDFSDNLSDYDQSIQDRKQSKLRPHQQEALDFMKSNNTGVMQLFCGTGKSRIMYDFMIKQIKKYKKYNTLIVIPSLPLIEQFNQSYIQDIDNAKHRESKYIDLNTHIIDSDNYSTLQPEHLAKDANLVIISYASLDKLKDHIHHFNLIMFDEAHHIVTKKKIAFIQQIPDAKVFYFTATPKIDKKLLNMYENDATNPINCGQVFKYDFRTAVQDQWVVDYQLNFCIYKQLQDQPDSSNNKDQFNALVQFAEIHKRTRIIAFNQYINKTSDVKTNSLAFADLGTDKVQIQTICGTTNPDDRKLIFDWFQQDDYSTTKIIFNASCIKEGIDLPCCDLVVFCDDKQSPIQIVQCIGRGTRLSKNKQNALITAMTPQSDQCEFKIITNICKALKDSDTQMRDIMDKQRLAQFIKFTNCTGDINPANSVIYKDFTDKIVVKLTQQDRYHYGILDQIFDYCKNNNKLPSQSSKDMEIKSMGYWLCARKGDQRKGKLDKNLKIAIDDKLTEFGFKWEVDQLQEHYDKLQEIFEYSKKNNKLPSRCSKYKEIKSMGKWLSQRKGDYKGVLKRNKQRILDPKLKIAIETTLMNFGFVWEVDRLQEHYDKLQEILEYCQKTNKIPSNNNKDKEITSMSNWLSSRKENQKKGKLDKDLKIAIETKLKDFGFVWEVDRLQENLNRLEEIFEYCQKTNKLPNTNNQDTEIVSMGNWLSSRRGDLKKDNLDKDLKIAMETKLKEFGFQWEVDRLQEHYDKLQKIVEYCQKINKLPTTNNQDTEIASMGNWLSSRRGDLKKDNLDKDLKIAIETKLKEFGFYWDQLEEYYDRLQDIFEYSKNNKKIPSICSKDTEIASMGKWLSSRKRDLKKDNLDKDLKIAIETKLKDFGFVWEVDRLQEHLNRLLTIVEYCQKTNKLPTSTTNKDKEIVSMGQWLSSRKEDYTQGNLDKDLEIAIETKLKDYGFVWEVDRLQEHYDKLQKLLEYCQNSNKLPSNNNKDKEIASMGQWLNTRKLEQKKGNLDKDLKIAIETKLKDFGFQWEVDRLKEHYDKLQKIVEYCQKTNKLPNADMKDREIARIGKWLSSRKEALKKGKLDKDLKIAIETKLKEFGFKWECNKGVTQSIPIIPPSIIKDMHQIAFTSNTDTLYNRFKNNPVELINYHKQRELNQSQKQPDHLPHNIVINELKSLKFKGNRAVIDLGCGLNKIADEFKESIQFTFTSIDFQIMEQSKGNVQQGDISNLPQFEDSSYWLAIMSLCFWGRDFINSIKECNRLLEDGGLLYIVQTNKKMEGFIEIIQQCGFVVSKQTIIDKYTLIKCKKE